MAMNVRISSNAAALAQAWTRRAQLMVAEMQRATSEATRVVYAESRKQLNTLIYDKPVPTLSEVQQGRMSVQQGKGRVTKFAGKGVKPGYKGTHVAYRRYGNRAGGKKAWTRTNALKQNERMRVVSPYEGRIENKVVRKSKKTGQTRPYAFYRHNMKHTRYPAPWRTVALANTRAKVQSIYHNAMIRVVRAGIVSGRI